MSDEIKTVIADVITWIQVECPYCSSQYNRANEITVEQTADLLYKGETFSLYCESCHKKFIIGGINSK